MESEPIVHVIDDDGSIAHALGRLLRVAGYEVRCYASAGEFLVAEHADRHGCIVLDIMMPGPSGLDLYEALRKNGCAWPVVFLTGHGDIRTGVTAIKAGAIDFLTKPFDPQQLLSAVADALSRDRAQRRGRDHARLLRQRYDKLTAREREVFGLVTEGKLNKQIAAELCTSERTIKAHRGQVMRKMEARSVPELVRAADRLG
jgi:FixJ family two-component response regulator